MSVDACGFFSSTILSMHPVENEHVLMMFERVALPLLVVASDSEILTFRIMVKILPLLK